MGKQRAPWGTSLAQIKEPGRLPDLVVYLGGPPVSHRDSKLCPCQPVGWDKPDSSPVAAYQACEEWQQRARAARTSLTPSLKQKPNRKEKGDQELTPVLLPHSNVP